MSEPLTLVSLNVQHSFHVKDAAEFLSKRRPDVALLQEVFESDLPILQDATGAQAVVFAPMTYHKNHEKVLGVAAFSTLPSQSSVRHYVGAPDQLPTLEEGNEQTFNSKNFVLAQMDVELGNSMFRFATTHFTWSPQGKATDLQRAHMRALLDELDRTGEFVLTGDFNAPRGGEIWNMLASRYKDNVPPQYKTSIDIALHRAGKTRPEELADKMVDGIFSTPTYTVSDVEMVCGVSDHCALVAKVARA